MTDIHGYIRSLTPPLSRDAIYRELVKQDATLTRREVSNALKELGFVARNRKAAHGRVAHLWIPCDAETKQPEPAEVEAEAEKTKPKSTEQIIEDVEERNEQTTTLNARLLESLKVSRDLKEELMKRQREALVSMARQVLSLFGDDYEQQRYRP